MGEAAERISENRRGNIANLIPYKPGQSGNPGGRPKGLSAYIREKTLEGHELADFLMGVMRGSTAFAKIADRLKACEMLMDRAFGRHFAAEADPNVRPILDMSKLTTEELAFIDNVRLGLASIGQRIASGEAEEKP